MSKKIFALFLSIIMTSTISPFVFAETTDPWYDEADNRTVNYLDLTSKFDADGIAAVGETINPKTWIANQVKGIEYGNCGGYPKQELKSNGTGMVEFSEYEGSKTSIGTFQMKFPEEGQSAQVNDCVKIVSDGVSALTLPLEALPTDKIRFAALTAGGAIQKITVNYADGTSVLNEGPWRDVFPTIASKIHDYSKVPEGNAVRVVGIKWFTSCKWAKPDENNVIGLGTSSGNNVTSGIAAYEIPVDKTKIPVSVTFKIYNGHPTTFYYAVNQNFTTNEYMKQFIQETNTKFQNFSGLLSAEEMKTINSAAMYARILDKRHIVKKEDNASIFALENIAIAQNNSKEPSYIDFSSKFNVDTIAAEGETIDPATWFLGNLSVVDNGDFGGFVKKLLVNPEGDYVHFNEYRNGVKTGNKIKMYFPQNSQSAKVLDATLISTEFGVKKVDIPLNNMPTKRIQFVANYRDAYSIDANISYSDETLETFKVHGRLYSGFGSKWAESSLLSNNPRMAGEKGAGYLYAIPNENNVIQKGSNDGGNKSSGLGLFEIDINPDKIPLSITFDTNSRRPTIIYAVTQNPVVIEEMISYVESMNNFGGVFTAQDEATAIKAYEYAKVLYEMKCITSEKYLYIKNFMNQVNAQKNNYIDLSKYLNSDLMVADGDKVPTDYSGRTDYLFNGALIPNDGMVTMKAPGSVDYTSTETGKTFKLSGAYNTVGNDSIKVEANKNPVTIDMAGNKSKSISVILDSDKVDEGTSIPVNVTVSYADKTQENITVNLYLSSGFNTRRFFAAAGGYGRVGITDGLFVKNPSVGNVEGNNPLHMYSSDIPYDKTKSVKSLTFNPIKSDYNIFAITEFVYTNQELSTMLDDFFTLNVLQNSDINDTNVDGVIKGSEAICQLYLRGFTNLVQESDYIFYKDMLAYANEYKNPSLPKVTFDGKISKTATTSSGNITMTNTTETDIKYVMVIAAYDSNNKMVKIKINDVNTLKAGSVAVTDTISTDFVEGALYKVFLWENLTDIKPIYMYSE